MSFHNTVNLINSDVNIGLKTLPEKSVQCVVTSPPYFGLRNYGIDGQIGLENTPEEYVERMVGVFQGVKRVLRDDGTVWLNLGDSYWGGKGKSNYAYQERRTSKSFEGEHQNIFSEMGSMRPSDGKHTSIKSKDLVGIPWMVAFALRSDGWYLRSDIIWSKPNPMPESVQDRPTKAHEYVFLLTKSPRYFYDSESIREESKSWNSKIGFNKLGQSKRNIEGRIENREDKEQNGRNRRTVWNINTKPFKEAHFAVFPEKLVEPCIKAGTSEKGCCPECGNPKNRSVGRECTGRGYTSSNLIDGIYKKSSGKSLAQKRQGYRKLGMEGPPPLKTTGWASSCTCQSENIVPCTVLDPFMGSGTTGVVALRLGRKFIGIELNPDYIKIAENRLSGVERDVSLDMFL